VLPNLFEIELPKVPLNFQTISIFFPFCIAIPGAEGKSGVKYAVCKIQISKTRKSLENNWNEQRQCLCQRENVSRSLISKRKLHAFYAKEKEEKCTCNPS
jgi:hypothetical protein